MTSGEESRLFTRISETKESVEREIRELRRQVHKCFADMRGRFDAQGARLDRYAGLWQTGH